MAWYDLQVLRRLAFAHALQAGASALLGPMGVWLADTFEIPHPKLDCDPVQHAPGPLC